MENIGNKIKTSKSKQSIKQSTKQSIKQLTKSNKINKKKLDTDDNRSDTDADNSSTNIHTNTDNLNKDNKYCKELNDITDIQDDDEDEICKDDEELIVDDVLSDEKYKETIKNVYIIFLNKYEHLNNYKNKKIILNMCIIVVNSMPEHNIDLNFYLNFIESTINELKENNNLINTKD